MTTSDLDDGQWQRHVARWRAGGLTVPAYCEAHGLAVGAMRYQIRRRPAVEAPAPMPLARVERVPDAGQSTGRSSGIVIELGRARIRVERGADAATLATVLAAVETTR